jgi:hypothetical protein
VKYWWYGILIIAKGAGEIGDNSSKNSMIP